jgi:hypothetical protein
MATPSLKRLLAMTIQNAFDMTTCFYTCPRTLSLRWSETTEAICLQVALVFGLLRYARNDKKNKIATRHKCRSPLSVRDDNPELAARLLSLRDV